MIGKREFNEAQRGDIVLKTDGGIRQAESFNDMIREWTKKYGDLASSGLTGSAKNYYESLGETLNRGKNDINKIFDTAEQVENDYAKKFGDIAFEMGLYAERIKALRDVLKTPTGSTINAFNLSDFETRLSEAIYRLNENEANELAKFYIEDGKWKGYIKELVGKEPQDITYAEYLAMILIFEKIELAEKAEFIKMSYRELPYGSYLPDELDLKVTELIGFDALNITFYRCYEISPVFATMAVLSQAKVQQMLNDMPDSYNDLKNPDDSIHQHIFNSQLLINILSNGEYLFYMPTFYLPYDHSEPGKFEVKIEPIVGMPWDHKVTINGYTNGDGILNGGTKFPVSFDLRQFRIAQNLDKVLKDNVLSTTVTMIPTAQSERQKIAFETAVGLIPLVGNSATIVFSLSAIEKADNDLREATAKVSQIEASLSYGNLAQAVGLATVLTVMPDGSFITNSDYMQFDEGNLKKRLDAYCDSTAISLNNNDIMEDIRSGNINDPDLMGYVQWYCDLGGAAYCELREGGNEN